MAIHTTQYSPDTCDCILQYDFDDTLDETNRVHTLNKFVNICSEHSIVADGNQRWNIIKNENPRKRQGFDIFFNIIPANWKVTDPQSGQLKLRPDIKFSFSFSGVIPNRVLTIMLTGATLTQNQKNTVQSALDNRFGTGKVLIA